MILVIQNSACSQLRFCLHLLLVYKLKTREELFLWRSCALPPLASKVWPLDVVTSVMKYSTGMYDAWDGFWFVTFYVLYHNRFP